MFGPLQVQTSEQSFGPSDLGGVKPKELFEILLLARGRPVTKDVLADRLWPSDPPKNTSATLETYISVLRKRLFSDRTVARRVLVTTSGAYKLVPDTIGVDLDEFDRLVARSDRSTVGRLDLRRQAAALAVGDLLEDTPHAAWLQTERDVYRDRVTRVNVLVAEELLEAGDFAGAIKHGEQAMAIRPYAEEAVRAVMLANYGLGQAELARQVYDRCCHVLAVELDRDCTTETADLAGAIDAGATISELLDERATSTNPVRLAAARQRDRREFVHQMPFIGRTAELERVHQMVEASRSGRFEMVLVRGRPGSGRTAFLSQLYGSVPGTVGAVKYSPLDSENPKLPLADALRDALRDGPGIIDANRYATAALLTGGQRAMSMLVEILRSDAPLVLFLDDLQWADTGTITTIEALRRRVPELPVTIVGAVRDVAPGQMRTLDLLATSDTIHLSALSEQDWTELEGVDPALVRSTGGLPRLMADCYRWRKAGNSGESPSLRETVLGMTRGLGGAYPRLLQEASLQPEPFGPFDLMATDGLVPMGALDSLERLCELDVLEQVPGGFRFRASIVRDVIASTVSGEPRIVRPTQTGTALPSSLTA